MEAKSSMVGTPTDGFVLNAQPDEINMLHGAIPVSMITTSVTIKQQMVILQADDKVIDLMAIAVNNRTRERNYFKLYSEMLEGKISEDDFDRLIEENPDKYVPENFHDFTPFEMVIARKASDKLMDVADLSDMAALFSISMSSLRKSIGAHE